MPITSQYGTTYYTVQLTGQRRGRGTTSKQTKYALAAVALKLLKKLSEVQNMNLGTPGIRTGIRTEPPL